MFAHLLEDPVGGVEMRHVAAAPAAIGILVGGVVAGAGVDDADDDGGRGVDARVGPVHMGAVGVLRHWKAQRMVSALSLSCAECKVCGFPPTHAALILFSSLISDIRATHRACRSCDPDEHARCLYIMLIVARTAEWQVSC